MRYPQDQKYHVYFNNRTLTYDFYASDLRIEGMPVNIGQLAVPGKDGALFTGSRLEPKHIRVTLTNRATSMADRRDNMSWLMGVLDVDEPKKLSLGIDGSTTFYYLAIPTTVGDIGIFRRHMSVEVDFLALDPVMYGEQVTKTIPSGGSLTFTVGGKTLTSYKADVDTDDAFTPDTEVVENGVFFESKFRSAPYFDIQIDGIKLLNTNFG